MKLKIKSYKGNLVDLTVNKEYEVTHNFEDGDFGIEDDAGFWFITRVDSPCEFLNGGFWEIVE